MYACRVEACGGHGTLLQRRLLSQFLSAPLSLSAPPFQICLSRKSVVTFIQIIITNWANIVSKFENCCNTFNIWIARLVAVEKQPQLIDVHNASRISIGNCQPVAADYKRGVTLRLKDLFLEPFSSGGRNQDEFLPLSFFLLCILAAK